MYGVVYSVTNNLDGKQYVGQTTRTLEERFSEHAESDSLLDRAIQRDGAENFLEDDRREDYVLSNDGICPKTNLKRLKNFIMREI